MDAVIIVFVMATGFVAVTVVLPIIFWFTQTSTNQISIRPAQNPNSCYFQTKPLPAPQPRPNSYTGQANTQNHQNFQVKALPPYSIKRSPTRRMAVAS